MRKKRTAQPSFFSLEVLRMLPGKTVLLVHCCAVGDIQ